MLKIENLTFRYGLRSAPVLQGVNMELQPGEIGIIMGKNGALRRRGHPGRGGIHDLSRRTPDR